MNSERQRTWRMIRIAMTAPAWARLILAASAAFSCIDAGIAVAADKAGNADVGRGLARLWCSSCHVVDDTAPGRGSDMAPPFATIAQMHGGDSKWLRAWLVAPHPPMPNLHLSRGEIDDLVAYLNSLPRR